MIVKAAVHLPEGVLISFGVALLLWRNAFKLRTKVGLESIQHVSKDMRKRRILVREAHLSPWQDVAGIGEDEADVLRETQNADHLEILLHSR